jgi:hypothetical protein
LTRRLAALLTAAATLLAAAAPTSAATPEDIALRLADVGPGSFIPDESCLPSRLRGDGTSRVVDQLGRLPRQG